MAEAIYRGKAPAGFLTMAEATERLGVAKRTFQGMVRRGAVTVYRDPRDQRVRLLRVEDVERLTRPVPEKVQNPLTSFRKGDTLREGTISEREG